MREPELLRWVLPGMVLGWMLSDVLTPILLFGSSCFLAVLSGFLLLRYSAIGCAVIGALLLGCSVGVAARVCVHKQPVEARSLSPTVLRFELTRPWPARGAVQRWLALDPRKQRVLLEAEGEALQAGQVLLAGVCRLEPNAPVHRADFDEEKFLRARGVTAKYRVDWCATPSDAPGLKARLRRAMSVAKNRVAQRCISLGGGDTSGLLLALITGDKSGVSRSTRGAFSDVGLSHLVAVSGFHIGLVAGFLLLWLRLFRCPLSWRPYVFLPLVWIYVGLCGWPGSAVRAAAMTSVAAVAVAVNRKPDGLTVLSAVGLGIAAIQPKALGDLGVGLSFLATAGILLLHRCLRKLGWSGWPRFFCMLLGVPVVATACTAPLSWPAFGKLPLCFVATNVMATPLVMAILVLFAAWCVLPQALSLFLKEALVQVIGLFLGLAKGWAGCQVCTPFLLPLDRAISTGAGCAVAVGCMWGLAVRRPLLFGLAGALSACALLRWSDHSNSLPQEILVGEDCVVFERGRAAVFGRAPRPGDTSRLKWKTRSLTERVSNDPPDSIRWCGTQWAMTPYHIRFRTVDGGWRVVSSSR